jgi:undecaprenyl-diphosphatase
MKKAVYAVWAAAAAGSFLLDSKVNAMIPSFHNSLLDFILGAVTHIGSVVAIFFIMTSLFLWEERKREWIPALWASLIAATVIVVALKLGIARARPLEIEYLPLLNIVDYSFPSMHAAASFAALPILDKEYPKFKWLWLIFALMVAFSRIYLQAHFLSDVLFGALIGFFIGDIFTWTETKTRVFRRWIFSR